MTLELLLLLLQQLPAVVVKPLSGMLKLIPPLLRVLPLCLQMVAPERILMPVSNVDRVPHYVDSICDRRPDLLSSSLLGVTLGGLSVCAMKMSVPARCGPAVETFGIS